MSQLPKSKEFQNYGYLCPIFLEDRPFHPEFHALFGQIGNIVTNCRNGTPRL